MNNVKRAFLLSVISVLSCSGNSYAADLIPLDDFRSKAILDSATTRPEIWSAVAHVFESYETQRTQAFCGVASTVIALNSLGVPGDTYVDNWYPFLTLNQNTIFTKDFLSIKAPNKINMEGFTLDQLGAAIATNKFVKASTYHATPELGVENFKRIVIGALTDPNSRVVINYLRGKIRQAGAGHHSPLAAYDANTDRVLIMDTARYKNDSTDGGLKDGSGQPVWVTLDDLWSALNTEDQIDNITRVFRGFIVITKKNDEEIKNDKLNAARGVIRQYPDHTISGDIR